MQKITPFLWFDNQAEEAVTFYTSLFPDAKTGTVTRYDAAGAEVSGQPEGSVLTVDFELAGQSFIALNGGSAFKFTPAISFFVYCKTEEEIDQLWEKLSEGGTVMMPYQKYDFSPKYGWLNDKYGVSWQLHLGENDQKILPCFLFVNQQHGKAEQAMQFYTKVFPDSGIDFLARYEEGEDTPGTIKHGKFNLGGYQFLAMDSGLDHHFDFSLATSFLVDCTDQAEVDYYWDKLSADKSSEQCGWLKDTYGVSWQIVPTVLKQLLSDPDPAKAQAVMRAMLSMKKFVVADLEQAHHAA